MHLLPWLTKHPLIIHNLLKKSFMFTRGGKGSMRSNLQPRIFSEDSREDCPRMKTTPLRNGLPKEAGRFPSADVFKGLLENILFGVRNRE